MKRRLVTLAVVGFVIWLLVRLTEVGPQGTNAKAAFMLGFALLAASLLGEIVEHLRLPRITGYILAGIFFGPYAAGFLNHDLLHTLGIFDDMAYAFIGLAAGAELNVAVLKGRAKSITLLILATTTVVMVGVASIFYVAARVYGPFGHLTPIQVLSVAAVVGVIAAARSPSSAIAIIAETRADGPFTKTILGVSVAMDVVVIVLFSVAIALCGLAFVPQRGLDLSFVISLSAEIVLSVVLGLALGAGMALYMRHKGPQLPLVITGLCFLVYRCSILVDHYLQQQHGLVLHLEPLLICAAAGFTIRNLSLQGDRLLEAMDWIALPVYVIFFTMAGAKLNLAALQTFWIIAVALAASRIVMITIGTRVATTLAGDPPAFRRYCWLGFITQAGLSLALVGQIEGMIGGWGAELATVIVATITVNQIIGPAAFKIALQKVGEVGQAKKGNRSRS